MLKTFRLPASVAALLFAGGLGASFAAAEAPAKPVDGTLATPDGMTLYTFDKDVADAGKSACNGPARPCGRR